MLTLKEICDNISYIQYCLRRILSWNTSRLSKHVTFAKALKKAVAANARLLASPLAKQAAVSQISSAKAPRKASNCNL